MYFNNFDKIYYDFEINGERKLFVVSDITKNVRIRKEILANITLYDEYDIKDGETPEIIAEKIYGNAQYHWIIMLVNQKYDYVSDFPLPLVELEKFITQKYGSGNEYDTHHYVNLNGDIVDEWDSQATSVSNYAYEDAINESKRRIKIVSINFINTLLKNFKTI
jgi:hypothetical protein